MRQSRFISHFRIFLIGILPVFFTSSVGLTGNEVGDDGFENRVSLDFREWPVPWENTRPRDPDTAPDGSVWFVGQAGDYVGRLDPETGEMDRFDIPGAGPHTVIVDREGYPWYAGNRDRHIGKLDPETGDVTRFDLPQGVNDPHTMDWTSDGDIWFTVQRSAPAGYIGKLAPDTRELEIIDVPGTGMRPYGLVVDADDRPWIAFMGTNAIGTIEPGTTQLEIIKTPDEGGQIRRIGLTSDGRVWWVDAARGFVGVYNPEDETMKQWRSPGGRRAFPYALTVDGQDRVWYVETGPSPNRFIGFDSATEEFISINEVPSGGGSVRHMIFDEERDVIWFGTDENTVGRARVVDAESAGGN